MYGNVECTNLTETVFNEGTNFRVVNYKNRVEMWTRKGDLVCTFDKPVGVQLVPWVQFTGKRSVSVELTGRGGEIEDEPCEAPPEYVCPATPEPELSECALLFS
jgi:hypothetical protein